MNGMPAGLLKRHNIHVRRGRQNAFTRLDFPIAGVNNPHCCRHGTLHPRHQIDPLSNAGILFEKTRIHHIHTAGIGDVIVNHHHFTVLAKIHTA
ncbi:hypothetical protein NGUA41_04850 [Salmonella enterica]|nr:hypothetical protein NGUA41_04850 [Salmonella enterica]